MSDGALPEDGALTGNGAATALDAPPARGAAVLDLADNQAAGPSLDPAQESLASALRLTFRIVQFVMVLLVAAFLISGVQTVGESERGIKLLFGRVSQANVQPGIRWNWPYPFGEIVRVGTSQESLSVGDAFMPRLSASQRSRRWTEITTTKNQLKPGEDGSVVTADGAIAHLECSVAYHRDDPVANAQHVYSLDEASLVRLAVQRGVVLAVAQTPIDALLRQSASGSSGSLSEQIRRSAQAVLDRSESGIVIDTVSVRDPRPPLAVAKEFDAVAQAEAEAAKVREEASQAARLALTDMAGEAAEPLLDRIDAYERALELGSDAGETPDAVLAQIEALLEGRPVEIGGRTVEAAPGGQVTEILNQGRQYRTDVVARARSRAEVFQAKLAQFRTDPAVLVASDWADAYLTFLSNHYETILVPEGSEGELILTPDPSIPRKLERERNLRQAQETIQGKIEFLQNRSKLREQERLEREARQRRQQGRPSG
ncbi:MAG: hypothetical protein D6693_01125 [Planctomycetota bacterium]|nr:MAG: hypothetical protein D6693_01125 [Planctomycetota bacterium]